MAEILMQTDYRMLPNRRVLEERRIQKEVGVSSESKKIEPLISYAW